MTDGVTRPEVETLATLLQQAANELPRWDLGDPAYRPLAHYLTERGVRVGASSARPPAGPTSEQIPPLPDFVPIEGSELSLARGSRIGAHELVWNDEHGWRWRELDALSALRAENRTLRTQLAAAELALGFPIVAEHVKRHEQLAADLKVAGARVAALEAALRWALPHAERGVLGAQHVYPAAVIELERARALLAEGDPDNHPDSQRFIGADYGSKPSYTVKLPLQGSNLDSPDPETHDKANHEG
jgi:hypothetical protein